MRLKKSLTRGGVVVGILAQMHLVITAGVSFAGEIATDSQPEQTLAGETRVEQAETPITVAEVTGASEEPLTIALASRQVYYAELLPQVQSEPKSWPSSEESSGGGGSNTLKYVLIGAGVLAIVGLAVVVASGGDDEEEPPPLQDLPDFPGTPHP